MAGNPEEPKNAGAAQESKTPRSPYAALPFDLQKEELTQTGTQKMLLGEVERLTVQVGELKDAQKTSYATDKKLAVLRSQFQQYTALEILYTMGVAYASGVLGWLLSLTSWAPRHYIALFSAFLLAGVAVWGKWMGVHHED